MSLIVQSECCLLLGIDPKTLRVWLRQAQMAFTPHPTDARRKCLTMAQVQRLAQWHDRLPITALPSSSNQSVGSEEPLSELRQHLQRLQSQVATLQDQVTRLALEVLHGYHHQTQQRLSTLEAPVVSPNRSDMPPIPHPLPRQHPAGLPRSRPGRSRPLPLIATTATGTYVVLCPTQGELPFLPDSSAWFEWLGTLTSCRFMGQQGRLSLYRNPGRSCWMAYRRIHGHRYERALGHTDRLTIQRLEQMAATFQSHAIG